MDIIPSNSVNFFNKIYDGDFVIIQKLHDKVFGKLVKVEANNIVYINKVRYNLKNLIGKEYGSIYTMDNKEKCLNHVDNIDEIFETFCLAEEDDEEIRDNRFILNDSSSQRLSREEIENFKSGQYSTKEIIETLVENSLTFKEKTVYSQEKYLKKKQEKYSNYLRVYKPNASLLCEMYFNQGPHKTNHLRIDSLSQMLSYCNIRSGCKYLVIDTCVGLLTASVVERLLGDISTVNTKHDPGTCVQVFMEPGPVSTWRQAVYALNYSEDTLKDCLLSVPIKKILGTSHKSLKKEKFLEEIKISENFDKVEDSSPAKKLKLEERQFRKKKRITEEQKALSLLDKKDFDGLLVITRQYEPSQIVNYLLEFLSPSSPFVVFSNFIDPLTDCYKTLKNKAINIKMNETWMRKYQILPFRTRPDMAMSGKSGFVLTGIKVDTSS